MEVDEAGVWRPTGDGAADVLVARAGVEPNETAQVVAGPDVVGGEDAEAPESAEQRVLRRPAPDSAKALECDGRRFVAFGLQLLEIEFASSEAVGKLHQGTCFGVAEAEVAQKLRVGIDDVGRFRAAVRRNAW